MGVIFGDNTIEYDEEDDVNRAILHGFLFDGYCQDAVDIMNRRKTVDCSVELSIREMSFNAADKVLTLDDFYVSGLTLLGAKIKPGMKGSQVTIEDFCEIEISVFSHNEKLIEMLQLLNTKIDNLSNFTIQESNSKKLEEGGNETVTKFEELLEKYGKTVEDITFEYENLSDEELEAKFAEMFEEEDTDGEGEDNQDGNQDDNQDPTSDGDDGEDDSDDSDDGEGNPDDDGEPSDDGDTEGEDGVDDDEANQEPEQFAEKLVKTYEISHDDIRWALYNLLSAQEDADNEWYFINAVYDNHFTYESWSGEKIYGQSYTKEDDNIAFDGERWNLHRELLTDSEYAELMSMRSNYASLAQFKEDTENAQLHAQREEILYNEKYSVLTEKDENNEYKNEAYAKLVSEMDNYSLTDLEKELKSVFADYITNGGQFAYNGESEVKPVVNKKLFTDSSSKSKKSSRYGNLFNK